MLRIRLRRTGRSKAPSYRVVVAHGPDPRDGDFVEVVGHYNPAASPKILELQEERVRHWLSVGAKPSETVHRLLHSRGLIETAPPTRITKPSRAELEAVEAAEAAAAEAEAAEGVEVTTTSVDGTDPVNDSDGDDAEKAEG